MGNDTTVGGEHAAERCVTGSKREWEPRHTEAYPVAQVGLEVCVTLIPLPQPSDARVAGMSHPTTVFRDWSRENSERPALTLRTVPPTPEHPALGLSRHSAFLWTKSPA